MERLSECLIHINSFFKSGPALAGVAQLFGAQSRRPKGHGFDSQSEHIPGLLRSLVGACKRKWLVDISPPTLSLSLSLPPSPSSFFSLFLLLSILPLLPPSPFSKRNEKMSSGEDKKKSGLYGSYSWHVSFNSKQLPHSKHSCLIQDSLQNHCYKLKLNN